MPQEERDVAIVEGHLENAGMLQSVLSHIDNVLMPLARAKKAAAGRSVRRSNAKRARKIAVNKKKRKKR